jgi:virginiamycin B lyase
MQESRLVLGVSMLHASFIFIVMAMLVGCAGAPTERSAPTEPALGIATKEPSTASPDIQPGDDLAIQEYPVPAGSHPHDVAPAPDGTVWYTAQLSGELGRLDPNTGETRHIPLGSGSSPHGVIVGPDGAPWIKIVV